MENKIATINDAFPNIDAELDVLRLTLEQVASKSSVFHPIINFFDSDNQRLATVVVHSQSTFDSTLCRMAEALYLYPSLASSSAIIALVGDMLDDDGNHTHSVLSAFTITEDYGYVTSMPYSIDSSNNITWMTDQFESTNVLDKHFEGVSKEMLNMFYMFSHMERGPYTVHELATYLTFVGTSVQFSDKIKVSYYDMTPQSMR